MSKTMENGKVLIISFHDDDRYIELSGAMATAWQMIDGKRNWRKITRNCHKLTNDFTPIFQIMYGILTEKNFDNSIFLKNTNIGLTVVELHDNNHITTTLNLSYDSDYVSGPDPSDAYPYTDSTDW